jgi:hypothetical protein
MPAGMTPMTSVVIEYLRQADRDCHLLPIVRLGSRLGALTASAC